MSLAKNTVANTDITAGNAIVTTTGATGVYGGVTNTPAKLGDSHKKLSVCSNLVVRLI